MGKAESMGKYGRARSFGAAADEYERGRPGYPDDAVDWMLPGGARDVLDLGAGTGKLTRSLVARGLNVVAVEPLAEMRAKIEQALPTVRALDGTAESIPVTDASMDVVTAGQAWHWVDATRAAPEVARVLRPGGTLSLVWNIRDESVDWVRALSKVMQKSEAERYETTQPPIGAPFVERDYAEFRWTNRQTRAEFLAMAASGSDLIVLPPAEREAVLRRIETLLDTHPELAARPFIEMPYVTRVTRARLASSSRAPLAS